MIFISNNGFLFLGLLIEVGQPGLGRVDKGLFTQWWQLVHDIYLIGYDLAKSPSLSGSQLSQKQDERSLSSL